MNREIYDILLDFCPQFIDFFDSMSLIFDWYVSGMILETVDFVWDYMAYYKTKRIPVRWNDETI